MTLSADHRKPHDLQNLIELYQSGLTLRQIGAKIGRSHVAVLYRLRNVIKLRPRLTTRAHEQLERQAFKARSSPNLPAATPLGLAYQSDCPKCMNNKSVYAYSAGDAWTWACSSCGAEGVAMARQTGA